MKKKPTREEKLEALKKETDRAEREQIRRLLALPMNKRTHFLRVRLPGGGSSL
ncbi:MAG: hypothetical protein AAF492_06695 [Verrucomicrobiota bacterium]